MTASGLGCRSLRPLTDAERLMVEENLGLVGFVLARWGHAGEEADAYQCGVFGLMRAVQGFDPGRGFRFSTYAVQWIRQYVQRGQADVEDLRAGFRGEPRPLPRRSLDELVDEDLVLGHALPSPVDVEGVAVAALAADEARSVGLRHCRDDFDRAVLDAVLEGRSGASVARRFGMVPESARLRRRRLMRLLGRDLGLVPSVHRVGADRCVSGV